MRATHAVICLFAGVAACATPGQVRRVETAVTVADQQRARADSALRSDVARIRIAQRENIDSINILVRQLNDAIQRVSRENASNFDDLRQRLYQVATLANTTAANVNRLKNQVEVGLSSGPPAPVPADTSAGRGNAPGIVPQPDVLIAQARDFINQSALAGARRSLNQLLVTYPQAPQVADAYYFLGYTFETEAPDSARAYYNKVWKTYPKADKASVALYKLGNLEQKAGNLAAARAYWQQIIKDYKDTPESERAQALLRDNP